MAYRAKEDLVSTVLSADEVDELIILYRRGWTIVALAERFRVHNNTIRNVLRRVGMT